jgi:hypothetical protein
MYPRPRARTAGNKPRPVDLDALEEAVRHERFVYGRVWGIGIGLREWQSVKRDPEKRRRIEFWPGGEETFCGVSIIVRRTLGQPVVYGTADDATESLLEHP